MGTLKNRRFLNRTPSRVDLTAESLENEGSFRLRSLNPTFFSIFKGPQCDIPKNVLHLREFSIFRSIPHNRWQSEIFLDQGSAGALIIVIDYVICAS
jgi:hypothetical protein